MRQLMITLTMALLLCPSIGVWAEESPVADCPYLNVFVDPSFEHPQKDRFYPGWRDIEPYRVWFLNDIGRGIPKAGWHVVAEREDAAFVLTSAGFRLSGNMLRMIDISLSPTHKTIHHAFIASLNDSKFPLRDRGFGASHTLTMPRGPVSEVDFRNFIDGGLDKFLDFTKVQAFETVAALCETREQLTKEGTSLEELRRELIVEIQRVRRARKREKQEKELNLEIETR